LQAHEWRTYRDVRLRALADSPQAFGSTFVEESVRDDEEWAKRLHDADADYDLPLIAESESGAVGLVWGRIAVVDTHTANVYQMWVHPAHRRAGTGQRLLDAVIEWARDRGVHDLFLTVTCGNAAALRLYQRNGFEAIGEPTPLRSGSNKLAQELRLTLVEAG
jgi:ribosomal protein S18 acetylase RimI-like enzyme